MSGKFPPKIPNFSFISLWVKKYQGQSQIIAGFIVGQKHAWVELGWVRAHLWKDSKCVKL